ncbi:MAG: gephyrin-like molybdotransferase Glp [Candidatus Hydrothermarchaeota archaeon]
MRRLIRLEDAIFKVRERIKPVGIEEIRVKDSIDRILAKDVFSKIDVPPFDRSAMDGFAVIAEDTYSASYDEPVVLRKSNSNEVKRGECVYVNTGSPIPDGANAVVMVEYTKINGDNVFIFDSVHPLKNVSQKGEDLKKGDKILGKSSVIRPQDSSLMISAGIKKISVYKKPKIVVFCTGDELLEFDEELREGMIYETNSFMIRDEFFNIVRGGIIRDVEEEIERCLEKDFDAIIFTGGSSVGEKDLVPKVLHKKGELLVNGISIRPGEPTAIGFFKDKPVFCLPGNPVASFISFNFVVKPCILKMLDLPKLNNIVLKGRLNRGIVSEIGRRDFVRVKYRKGIVDPVMTGGSGILHSLVHANGVVIVDEDSEGFKRGEEVEVVLFSWRDLYSPELS